MSGYTLTYDQVTRLVRMAFDAGADAASDGYHVNFLEWCDMESERFGIHQGTVPVKQWVQESRSPK